MIQSAVFCWCGGAADNSATLTPSTAMTVGGILPAFWQNIVDGHNTQGRLVATAAVCWRSSPWRLEANSKIDPIKLNGWDAKTLAYADDIAVVSTGPKTALVDIRDLATEFGRFSGYRLNHDKTQVVVNRLNLQISLSPRMMLLGVQEKGVPAGACAFLFVALAVFRLGIASSSLDPEAPSFGQWLARMMAIYKLEEALYQLKGKKARKGGLGIMGCIINRGL
ncbi:hypothetical protein NDU88_007946 [Pleurodeles waltl]|uniref:Reverse transcriptase domain-containing protein n=1 Tax=Pleurodeles waltl TaxID=8319 RepID=A0AAV7NV23_PLEWA|nr:hypothetical protein NDU88_007946 [Pleurodeles waltl]